MVGKTYQDWCVDLLINILKKQDEYPCSLKEYGVKQVLKSIVTHYASIYYCEDKSLPIKGCETINIWWTHLNKNRWGDVFSRLLMSCKARKEILEIQRNRKYDLAKKKIHLEHIVPVAQTCDKLMRLKKDEITEDAIKALLKHNKVIVLTKGEQVYLDRSGKEFIEKDFVFVKKHFSKFYDAQEEVYKGLSPRSCGSALLRMAHLVNKEVTFCTYTGEDISPKQWIDYLESDFVIHKK
jgi:hypothetical protein